MAPSFDARTGSTAAYAALLFALVIMATPIRVGDGGEYLAMAMNLSRLEPPSLSLADLARVDHRLDTLGPSFRTRAVRFPALRGSDGRQDFPHFWMYPLFVSPFLAATDAAGLHPNYAFALANVLMLASAWWLVVPRHGTWLTGLVLVSPIVWWADKAHGDAFTYALLTVSFGLVTTRPALSLVALGLACSQNPPLSVTLPAVVAAAWLADGTSPTASVWPRASRRLPATVAAIGLALLPMAYYYARLGVPTPLVGWTSPHVPSAGEMARFVADPNIGLAWAFPGAIVVTIAALIATARTAPRALLRVPLLAGPVCALLLLAGFTQSLNINNGATPGVNRWSLWLVPLALPLWLAWRDSGTRRARTVIQAAAVASVVLSLWSYAPHSPERYVYASAAARWIWHDAPGLDNPPLEIFAERVSQTEPPLVPVATRGCTKVLVSEGRWPVPCAPWPLPPECRQEGQHCYANVAREGYAFVPVAMRHGFGFRPNPRTWPTGDAAAATIRAGLDRAARCGAQVVAAGERSVIVATDHVAWTLALQCSSEFLLYVAGPTDGARMALRLPGSMTLVIDDLATLARSQRTVPVAVAWEPVGIAVPASASGVLLHLR